MTCHNCHTLAKKFGWFISRGERIQRYRCRECGKTFGDIAERPLDALRIDSDKAVAIAAMMVEGVGVRAIARLLGVHRDTVLNVLEVTGAKCARLLDQRVRNHPFQFVQVDELFAFVHCKEKQNKAKDREIGEQYAYLSVCAESKFIVNFAIGKRDQKTTQIFIQDLRKRVKTPFQLSTDGFISYPSEVFYAFPGEVHFGQVIKRYENVNESGFTDRKYSPSPFVGVRKYAVYGNPSRPEISTSYVERTNLSVRMFQRRFTRLTLGFSKKLANLKHSTALFIAHFNYCRVHSAHGQTPAQACGLAERQWTMAELLSA